VVDQTTGQPIGEVSISLNEQGLGAISNPKGTFYLAIPAGHVADSVRLSHLGYATRTWSVAAFRQQLQAGGGRVRLQAQQVPLAEAQVSAKTLQWRVLGNSSDAVRPFYYFTDNTPGNQIGQRIPLKRAGWLEAVSFHLAACSYDTLYLRLNVYALEAGFPTTIAARTRVHPAHKAASHRPSQPKSEPIPALANWRCSSGAGVASAVGVRYASLFGRPAAGAVLLYRPAW
jgi:hypothetical protein